MSSSLSDPLETHLARYRELGWSIFPTRGKRPMVDHWREASTTDEELHAAWWDRVDPPGVAIDCGKSGIVVIDIDAPEGYGSLELLPERLPATMISRTQSGGAHYIYAAIPGVEIRNAAGRLPTAEGFIDAPSIDLRADGGYIIGPPTRGDRGRYRWLSSLSVPAPAPGWLRPPDRRPAPAPRGAPAGISSGSRYAAAAIRNELGELSRAAVGSRNHALFKAAAALGGFVPEWLSRASAEAALSSAASSIGLSALEAARTIRSGLDKGGRDPRQIE